MGLGCGALVRRAEPRRAGGAGPAIIAYVFPRGRPIVSDEIAAHKLTHINYAFANIKDGEMVEGSPRDTDNLRALASLRPKAPHLRLLVSVGGWTWSKGFSDMALTAESRRRFVDSAIAFARRHDLDGLDVDWEYPGLPGDANPHRPEDRENFTSLMAELRSALDREGAARERHLLLTIAAGAFPNYLKHTEMDKVWRSLDFVNLMTYDFYVPGGGSIAGHHANLYVHPDDPKQLSADRAVRDFRAAGVPADRMVLGVPFYGRAWGDVAGNGPYQPGKPVQPRLDTSPIGVDKLLAEGNGWARHWDAIAQAPFLWNPTQRIFVSLDDVESLALKARYVREQGLGGVMFWEYYADPSGRLLDALHRALRGGV